MRVTKRRRAALRRRYSVSPQWAAQAWRAPRVVMKDTMALDPTVDVYFHRLPARFIDPNPGPGSDVESLIGRLAHDLRSEDALLIFPEGGNYTDNRRTRAIARLRD